MKRCNEYKDEIFTWFHQETVLASFGLKKGKHVALQECRGSSISLLKHYHRMNQPPVDIKSSDGLSHAKDRTDGKSYWMTC